MPYTASSAPDYVPASERKRWAAIWNNAYERYGTEERAFAIANGVVLKGKSMKRRSNTYRRKASPLAQTMREVDSFWTILKDLERTASSGKPVDARVVDNLIARIERVADESFWQQQRTTSQVPRNLDKLARNLENFKKTNDWRKYLSAGQTFLRSLGGALNKLQSRRALRSKMTRRKTLKKMALMGELKREANIYRNIIEQQLKGKQRPMDKGFVYSIGHALRYYFGTGEWQALDSLQRGYADRKQTDILRTLKTLMDVTRSWKGDPATLAMLQVNHMNTLRSHLVDVIRDAG